MPAVTLRHHESGVPLVLNMHLFQRGSFAWGAVVHAGALPVPHDLRQPTHIYIGIDLNLLRGQPADNAHWIAREAPN
jgi:hypothetical protein